MKKICVLVLILSTGFGCTSTPPKPPEPIGEKTLVNPSNINESLLKL